MHSKIFSKLITCSRTVETQNAKLSQGKYRRDTKLYSMY